MRTSDEDDVRAIQFEEFDERGTLCGARRVGGVACAFGGAETVLAMAAGLGEDSPWVQAVCAAMARERGWRRSARRYVLAVLLGEGEMFHVSPSRNRASIARYGLDWTRMTGDGIAGSRQPEQAGIFLCDSREAADFFIDMGTGRHGATDVWAVDVTDHWLESDPGANGSTHWAILHERVPPSRIRLAAADAKSSPNNLFSSEP